MHMEVHCRMFCFTEGYGPSSLFDCKLRSTKHYKVFCLFKILAKVSENFRYAKTVCFPFGGPPPPPAFISKNVCRPLSLV
jgi:hypothetical protein